MMRYVKPLMIPVVVLVSLLLMLISLGYAGPMDMNSFINADSMFFHAMYNDLFIKGSCLWGWDLNTTFNLMPNAILYLLTLIIVNDPLVGQIVHGILQYGLFLWAAWYMLRSINPRPNIAVIATVLLLPAWFFINSMETGNYFLAAQFFHPYHFGALIMTCIITGMNLRELNKPIGNRRILWIVILAALASFSNRIFIVMFFLPWLVSLVVLWQMKLHNRKTLIKNAVFNTLGVLSGMLIFLLIREFEHLSFSPTKMFSWDNILPSFAALRETYLHFLLKSPILGVMLILVLAIFLVIVVKVIKSSKFQHGPAMMVKSRYNSSNHFLMFTAIFAPAVFFAPVMMGMFFSMASSRYNFMVIVWLMLALAPLLQRLWHDKPWQAIPHRSIFLMVLMVTIVFSAWFTANSKPREGLSKVINYYPPIAQCIDQAAKNHNLKDGISGFWDAKPISAFSKEGIKVRQVYHDLRPYLLGVNRAWYFPYCESSPTRVFNFIVEGKDINPEVIHNIFGNNIDTLQLDHCTIYLVPDFTFPMKWNTGIIFLEEESQNR